jgi:hypothetical protein
VTRAARAGAAVLVGLIAMHADAAPVDVYRTGPQFCPRDRSPDAGPMSREQAIERARTLLPREFCGPGRFVAGCDADTELVDGSWRVYLHQFQLRGGRHDWSGLTHTYVILDAAGNCLANIPGTALGAPN